MNKEEMYTAMKEAIISGDKIKAQALAEDAITKNMDFNEVIEQGFVPGIQKVGELWENGEYFLPELITSAECMKAVMAVLQPTLEKFKISARTKGKVVIGTIEGDIHDIGKNLVAAMLAANGFEVIDLGADVKLERFIETAETESADFICLSALLTTTMLGQKKLVEMLKEKNLYGRFKVMVGGAPVNAQWAREIEADGYAENAMTAVNTAMNLIS